MAQKEQVRKANVLIVEDEEDQRMRLKYVLESDGFQVEEAEDGDTAYTKISEKKYDLIITDLKMPGGKEGMDVLRHAKNMASTTQVFIITAYGTIENAVQAMINGAFDYIQKPVNMPEFRIKIQRALELRELEKNSEKKEMLKGNMNALLQENKNCREAKAKIKNLAAAAQKEMSSHSVNLDKIQKLCSED